MSLTNVVSFAEACEELRARALQVNKARKNLRRARNEVNVLCRTYRLQHQDVPETLLKKVVEDRTISLKRLKENLRALEEYILFVEGCDPKPNDWAKQVAVALVWPEQSALTSPS